MLECRERGVRPGVNFPASLFPQFGTREGKTVMSTAQRKGEAIHYRTSRDAHGVQHAACGESGGVSMVASPTLVSCPLCMATEEYAQALRLESEAESAALSYDLDVRCPEGF